jgi:hypothetical protein
VADGNTTKKSVYHSSSLALGLVSAIRTYKVVVVILAQNQNTKLLSNVNSLKTIKGAAAT